jgi:hypothetical protein
VHTSHTSPHIALFWFILIGSLMASCTPFQRGEVGESCRARNDCAVGLACLNEKCVPDSPILSVTGKACYQVECGNDAECCADFVPAANCALYEGDCQSNPNNCAAFRTYCQCNRGCANDFCVDTGPECTADTECPSLEAPYCVQSQCVQCREHGDCADESSRCIEGTCKASCKTAENCPPMHACNAGICVSSGCTTDRECVFVLGHPRSRCASGTCFVGCTDDSECNAATFEVCHEGRCVFTGCGTDAECRAYLDLSNSPGNIRAVCR